MGERRRRGTRRHHRTRRAPLKVQQQTAPDNLDFPRQDDDTRLILRHPPVTLLSLVVRSFILDDGEKSTKRGRLRAIDLLRPSRWHLPCVGAEQPQDLGNKEGW